MAVPPSGFLEADYAVRMGKCSKRQANKAKEIATIRASSGSTDINANDAMRVLLEKGWITQEDIDEVDAVMESGVSLEDAGESIGEKILNYLDFSQLDLHVVVCVALFWFLPPSLYQLMPADSNTSAFVLGLSLIAIFSPSTFGTCRYGSNFVFIWLAAITSLVYALMKKPIDGDVLLYVAAGFFSIPLALMAFFALMIIVMSIGSKTKDHKED